jgi:hypothetical protein
MNKPALKFKLSKEFDADMIADINRDNSVFSFFDYKQKIFSYITYLTPSLSEVNLDVNSNISKLDVLSQSLSNFSKYLYDHPQGVSDYLQGNFNLM